MPMISRRFGLKSAMAAAAFAMLCGGASAVELPAPEGRVLVTVSGAIGFCNADGGAAFDLAMLDALESRETVIETPWYEGRRRFSGPTLKALLEAVGASGDTLRVVALNDYSAEIPISDVLAYPVILATRIDGKVMSVREKGPGFVIYPFDVAPELYNEMIFGRSVWQVSRIEVR